MGSTTIPRVDGAARDRRSDRSMAGSLLRCDFDPLLFLCSSKNTTDRRQELTAWRFLDELPEAVGIDPVLCTLVRDYTDALESLAPVADELRDAGMLGHYQEVKVQMEDVRKKRAEVLEPHLPHAATAAAASSSAAATVSSAQRPRWTEAQVALIASEMQNKHACVIEKFLTSADATEVRALLGEMKGSGELQPGEVSGGLKQQTRGDLMAWVSTDSNPPQPLKKLLRAVDELVGALSREPALAADLGDGKMLVRHEMQCTCYPGNGARYVKHVDDALSHRSRRLTCIVYANPEWEAAHGGQLRLHLKGGLRDVPPKEGTLVLFWSDSRCPHEVCPAHRERYAVSIWYSDAASVEAAAKAEAAEQTTRG